eukprot:TRINITY_DN4840_c1_g1_i1.p1 TRINITY_DN4840_c1_g1~~TRINITY_DN4840_c1_g1_i1.p1  ORF type:complete len:107 (-),score=31.56 TRINITY_DN4840_c1_g1_i1:225-545(-)
MVSSRNRLLPAVLVLAAVMALLAGPTAFVPSPQTAPRAQAVAEVVNRMPVGSMALGAAGGLLAAQPAHAGMLYDEIIPYASATSFAILWGIVLGFVLLRLQEAFPE